jgi:hypothetical protein
VTAEPVKKNGVSPLIRTKALADGIYQEEVVINQLAKSAPDIWILENAKLRDRINSELDAACRLHVGLGSFDSTAEMEKIDLPGLAKRVQSVMPEVWLMLSSFMDARDIRSARETDV